MSRAKDDLIGEVIESDLTSKAILLAEEVSDAVQTHSLRLIAHEAQIVNRHLLFYTGDGSWLILDLDRGRVFLTRNRPDDGPWVCKKAPCGIIAKAIKTMKQWIKMVGIVSDWRTYTRLTSSQLADVIHLASTELMDRHD